LPNTGNIHHVELRSGGILLIPFNFTARAEKKQGSQTLALKIKPNLLLYKSDARPGTPSAADEHKALGAERPLDPAPEERSPL
jgi:hypothetical protein